ncbi:hypothetical protein SOVF_197690, partial [Spinacia oleracea]
FADAPPFTRVAYHGDLQGLVRTFATEGEPPQVIDLEANSRTTSALRASTTQIMFGSMPADVPMGNRDTEGGNVKLHASHSADVNKETEVSTRKE